MNATAEGVAPDPGNPQRPGSQRDFAPARSTNRRRTLTTPPAPRHGARPTRRSGRPAVVATALAAVLLGTLGNASAAPARAADQPVAADCPPALVAKATSWSTITAQRSRFSVPPPPTGAAATGLAWRRRHRACAAPTGSVGGTPGATARCATRARTTTRCSTRASSASRPTPPPGATCPGTATSPAGSPFPSSPCTPSTTRPRSWSTRRPTLPRSAAPTGTGTSSRPSPGNTSTAR